MEDIHGLWIQMNHHATEALRLESVAWSNLKHGMLATHTFQEMPILYDFKSLYLLDVSPSSLR